eukprot:scaffold2193_cov171-Amphora_coffeaeformis.AAC.3
MELWYHTSGTTKNNHASLKMTMMSTQCLSFRPFVLRPSTIINTATATAAPSHGAAAAAAIGLGRERILGRATVTRTKKNNNHTLRSSSALWLSSTSSYLFRRNMGGLIRPRHPFFNSFQQQQHQHNINNHWKPDVQHQKRQYVFLPTSWTELKLRLRQKAAPTVLRVYLQHYSRKLQQHLLWTLNRHRRRRGQRRTNNMTIMGAATRLALRKTQRRLSVAQIEPRKGHKGLFSRVREMFTGKGKLKSTLPRSVARKRPFSQEEVVKVTVEDYMEPHWFDGKGRPHVARDETGRFVNPWVSQGADGVKPFSVLWKWRKQRFRREIKEVGWKWFIPTFHTTQYKQIDAVASAVSPSSLLSSSSSPSSQRYGEENMFRTPSRPSTIRFTWIGHASCLIQQNNVTILTDPIFSERASPFPKTPIGIARVRPAACTISELPERIDVCLISHDHYDHLDKPSVKKLRSKVGLWIVPKGTKEWMITKAKVRADKVVELEWWESVQLVRDDNTDHNHQQTVAPFRVGQIHSLRQNPTDKHPARHQPPTSDKLWISCFPTQHWCSRTLWDRNYRLWASFAVLFPYQQTFYFSGDTALPTQFPLFAQIRSYLPFPVSLAALPIGAYEPRILNDDNHTSPVEAVKIHQELRSRRSVAIHHGSFPLSEEPLDEPPQWLSRAVREAGLPSHAFVSIPNGDYVDCVSATNRLSSSTKRRKK